MSRGLRERMDWDWWGSDRYVTQPIQCQRCKHWRGDATCEVFPVMIPLPILRGQHDHRKAYAGDGGRRFVAINETAEEEVDAFFADAPEGG